jgi:hypothetical protein
VGPDTEGGDARRPCHGHAACIRRLRRGVRVCGAGGYGGLSQIGAARGLAGDASKRGRGGREMGKGRRGGYGLGHGAGERRR